MGLGLCSCFTAGQHEDTTPTPSPRAAAVPKTINPPDAPQRKLSRCAPVSKQLLERLAAVDGADFLSRLQSSAALACALLHADVASLAALARAPDGSLAHWTVLASAGDKGECLQGLDCSLAANGNVAAEATSFQLLDRQQVPLPLLAHAANGLSLLPSDWRMLSLAGLRGFCALPLVAAGERQPVAVLTVCWSTPSRVPPGLRPPRADAVVAADSLVKDAGGGAAAGTLEGGAPAEPSELEELQQVSRILALGLMSDSQHIAYTHAVARMISVMARSPSLQAMLDALMAGCHDILLQRCHLRLGLIAAVGHPSLPNSAFILESSTLGAGPTAGGGRPASLGGWGSKQYSYEEYGGALSGNAARQGAQAGSSSHQQLAPTSQQQLLSAGGNSSARLASTAVPLMRPTSSLDRHTPGAMSHTHIITPVLTADLGEDATRPDLLPLHVRIVPTTQTLLQAALQLDAAISQDRAGASAPSGSGDGRAAMAAAVAAATTHAGPQVAPTDGAGSSSSIMAPTGCLVPCCSVHLQDEALPCRDIILCQRLLNGPLASLHASQNGGAAPASSGLHNVVQALALAVTRVQRMPAPGESSWCSLISPNSSAAARQGQQQGSGPLNPMLPSLALYLLSPNPLPLSLLQSVQAEAYQLLQLALPTFLWRVQGNLADEWCSLVETLGVPPAAGSCSSSNAAYLERYLTASKVLRSRSAFDIQTGVDGLLSGLTTSHVPSGMCSRKQSGGTMNPATGDLVSRPLSVVPARMERIQPLELIVSSFQSTLGVSHKPDTSLVDSYDIRGQDIGGVELLEVVGRGGQGVVFRGTLHGLEAAIKVIAHKHDGDKSAAAAAGGGDGAALAMAEAAQQQQQQQERAAREHKRMLLRDALELAVTSSLSHPNIVQMFCYFSDVVVVEYHGLPNRLRLLPADHEALAANAGATGAAATGGAAAPAAAAGSAESAGSPTAAAAAGAPPAAAAPAAARKPTTNTVMCMEFCDAGTLKSAAEAGAFRQPGVSSKNGPACPALIPLYTSLLEVATALRHLHSRKLVHVDLKPANVLLRSNARDPRGWVCKLSDFGCVRLMNEALPDGRLGFRQPQPLGTITHMAPEMFVKGQLLDASVDIYSFGILMFELIMVAPLYDVSIPRDRLPSLVRRGLRPVFHPLVPTEYKVLACACWADDPRRRPSAAVVVSTLQRYLSRACAQPSSGGAGPASVWGSGGHAAPSGSPSSAATLSPSGPNPVGGSHHGGLAQQQLPQHQHQASHRVSLSPSSSTRRPASHQLPTLRPVGASAPSPLKRETGANDSRPGSRSDHKNPAGAPQQLQASPASGMALPPVAPSSAGAGQPSMPQESACQAPTEQQQPQPQHPDGDVLREADEEGIAAAPQAPTAAEAEVVVSASASSAAAKPV